jgi:hypothetical protein
MLLGFLCGTLGATFGVWLLLEVVKRSRSACAIGAGFLAIPEVSFRFGAPAAAFGGALGVLVSGLRGRRSLRRPDMVLSLLAVVVLGGWGAGLIVPRRVVRPEVRRAAGLSEPALGELLESRGRSRNVYVLAAIASNVRASPQTLARIALRPEPELGVRPGTSLLDVLVTDSRDFDDSVMLLLTKNPGTPAESLERLASSSEPSVVAAVARNPKLSPGTLARLGGSSVTAVRCGVAANRSAGPELLERLSRDPERMIRLDIAWNPATPPEVRQRLQSDPDHYVREAASREVRTAAPSTSRGVPAEETDTPLLIR